MATTRIPIAGNSNPSPNSHSRGQRPKELPASLHPQSDGRVLKRLSVGEPSAYSFARGETEELPRIILVSGDDMLLAELSRVLDPCPLEIRTLKSCLDAANEIGRCSTASVIFADIQLPDGGWKHVLQLAREASARAEVILVARFVDVRVYLDALEAGAFDFVVPPFHTVELGYIIVNATYACFKQRTRGLPGHFPNATAV